MTLTFDRATQFLHVTHCLMMLNIWAKLFEILANNDGVSPQTSIIKMDNYFNSYWIVHFTHIATPTLFGKNFQVHVGLGLPCASQASVKFEPSFT
jgi:hypothetical protein